MCPQYRQRQTSELNEQGKNDIPVRCQGACAKSRRFLEILQNILISKLSLFYMHFSCQNTGTYSLKKPVNPRKLKVFRQQADRLDYCFIFQGQFFHFCSIHRDREVEDNLPNPVAIRLLFRE